MTATTIRITDDTPANTVLEIIEARTRRLMAERCAVPCWGDGRRDRADKLLDINDSLDEFNMLTLRR